MHHGTLDSKIDVWQEINVGPGKFGKNNKRRLESPCVGHGKFGKNLRSL